MKKPAKNDQTVTHQGQAVISHRFIAVVTSVFSLLSSLKVAIPLLVITIAVTIGGSFLPEPDFFNTWWYLSLLGLNGICLLFITILHIPMILERKGRNALIGVVVTHLGILIIIAGVIYGGVSGFRYNVKAIEGEMTIVPGLPFVIYLDELIIEEYPADAISHLDEEVIPRKRQESHITLLKNGEAWLNAVIAPGIPAKTDDITILPAFKDIGWYFELIVTDNFGRPKTVPVKPWQPPIFNIGTTPAMAHSLMGANNFSAQVFTMVDEQMVPLGVVSREQQLEIDGHSVSLGNIKRYTGLFIYSRPQAWVLVLGCLAMMAGLIWHFYFRHRDRRVKRNTP